MSEQKERMLGGQLYRPDDPQLIAELRHCQVLLQEFKRPAR